MLQLEMCIDNFSLLSSIRGAILASIVVPSLLCSSPSKQLLPFPNQKSDKHPNALGVAFPN